MDDINVASADNSTDVSQLSPVSIPEYDDTNINVWDLNSLAFNEVVAFNTRRGSYDRGDIVSTSTDTNVGSNDTSTDIEAASNDTATDNSIDL